jgi:hypothetical protein
MGETVKSLAAKTSLQNMYNKQIQKHHELFNYCNSIMHNITFFHVQILNYWEFSERRIL